MPELETKPQEGQPKQAPSARLVSPYPTIPQMEQYAAEHGVTLAEARTALAPTPQQVAEYKAKVTRKPPEQLAEFKKDGGYDVAAALAAGYTLETMTRAGFPSEAVKEAQKFAETHVQIGPAKEWVAKEDFAKLSEADRKFAQERGLLALDRLQESRGVRFRATHTEVRPNEWVPSAEFVKLSPSEKDYLRKHGVEAFNTWQQKWITATRVGVGIGAIAEAVATGEVALKRAAQAVSQSEQAKLALSKAQEKYLVERGLVPPRLAPYVMGGQGQLVATKQFTVWAPEIRQAFLAGDYTLDTKGPPGKEETVIKFLPPVPKPTKPKAARGTLPEIREARIEWEKTVKEYGPYSVQALQALGKLTRLESPPPTAVEKGAPPFWPQVVTFADNLKKKWPAIVGLLPGVPSPPKAGEDLQSLALEGVAIGGVAVTDFLEGCKQGTTRVASMWGPFAPAAKVAAGVGATLITFAAMAPIVGVTAVVAPKQVPALARDMGRWFKQFPQRFRDDPYWTAGEGVAVVVTAVAPLARVGRAARVWAEPYGVPRRAIGIEFSTGRIPIKNYDSVALGRAVALAEQNVMRGQKSGKVYFEDPNLGLSSISYRGTPFQQVSGGAIWSGMDLAYAVVPKFRVAEGGFYTSPWAAQRFVPQTAGGIVAERPGFMLVLTDASRVSDVPLGVLKRAKLGSEKFVKGAEEGWYGPSKTFRFAFESEIVAAPKTELVKSPSTLWSRIMGEKAGDFYTQYTGPASGNLVKGQLVPVMVFCDKGFVRQPPNPALLYAMKLAVIRETVKDFAEAVTHPKRTLADIWKRRTEAGLREWRLQSEVSDIMVRLDERARGVAKGKKGEAFGRAYREELVKAFKSEAGRIMRDISKEARRIYEATPKRFEYFYRRNLLLGARATSGVLASARNYRVLRETLQRARLDYKGRDFAVRDPYAYSADVARRGGELEYTRGYTLTPREGYRRISLQSVRARVTGSIPREYAPMVERARARRTAETRRASKALRAGRQLVKVERIPPRVARQLARVRTVPPVVKAPKKALAPPPKGRRDAERKPVVQVPITWRQGLYWVTIYPPYRAGQHRWTKRPPRGAIRASGKGSAYKTIQALGGDGSVVLTADMGIMDVKIIRPRRKPKRAAIKFKRDPKQKTRGDINLSLQTVRGVK